jgi:hypothetical protein
MKWLSPDTLRRQSRPYVGIPYNAHEGKKQNEV